MSLTCHNTIIATCILIHHDSKMTLYIHAYYVNTSPNSKLPKYNELFCDLRSTYFQRPWIVRNTKQSGEPVPEENFWTLWCKVRLTEADTPTIRLGVGVGLCLPLVAKFVLV